MFSKLLKHEWKANAGLLGILSLCALGLGLLGAGVLRGIIYMSNLAQKEDVAILGITGLGSILLFIFIALIAYALAVQFITVFRFYKSKFTDQGYLTFTLPVNVHQIFLSSLLNILIWLVISAAVVFAAICMIIFIGAGDLLKELFQVIENLGGITEEIIIRAPGYDAYNVLRTVQTIFSPIYSLILIMTSITIGCVVAKKHKILATIGMYYCINMAIGIVESVLTVVPTIVAATSFYDQSYIYMNITLSITLVLQVCLVIGGYFWSTYLMKHKLNLP